MECICFYNYNNKCNQLIIYSQRTGFQMRKVAALPNGEDIKLAKIMVESYKKVFEGVDPNLPLLSIAITGAMRSGKSFLINLFAKYLECIQQHVSILLGNIALVWMT